MDNSERKVGFLGYSEETGEMLVTVINDPIRNLAATVLKQAVKDKFRGTDRTTMQFWCDVLDVSYDAFMERAKGGITWRS